MMRYRGARQPRVAIQAGLRLVEALLPLHATAKPRKRSQMHSCVRLPAGQARRWVSAISMQKQPNVRQAMPARNTVPA